MSNYIKKVEIGQCVLYLGNCYDVIKEIPNNYVTLIHTDPPYLIHSDTNVGKFMTSRGVKSQQSKLIDADISNSFDYKIFKEFERVCKCPNYQMWCSKKQFIDYLIFAKESNYNWQDVMLYRNNALPNVRGKYQDKDYLVHMWKGRTLTGTYHQKVTDYHWNIGGKKEYDHPALKPVEPICNLVEIGSDIGDVVLDPFMGSGTTAEACIKTSRKFIGIEINEEYFNVAVNRVRKLLDSDTAQYRDTNSVGVLEKVNLLDG